MTKRKLLLRYIFITFILMCTTGILVSNYLFAVLTPLIEEPKVIYTTVDILVPGESEGVNYLQMGLPIKVDGSFKSWMNYETITAKTTKQYNMKQLAVTNAEGFRTLNGKYLIATGTYYGSIGTELRITLSSGKSFFAIIGEVKSDQHTDPLHQYHMTDKSMIEFIVDKKKFVNQDALSSGNMSNAGFEGYITKIEQVTFN